MQQNAKIYRTKLGEQDIIIETGKLAGQASGAVTIRQGDSLIFSAATIGGAEGLDFFPLTVDYEERMYAGGPSPVHLFRREGRPRRRSCADRKNGRPTHSPLFPEGMQRGPGDVDVAFCRHREPLDILCINAASASLMISDIPWAGPISAARIGYIDGELIVNPTFTQTENSKLDLVVAGTKEAIAMVECGADEVSEEIMVQALELAHQSIQPIIELKEQMA